MTHLTQSTPGTEGNTNSSARSRAWCITINNYEENIFDTLTQSFKNISEYIFGKEMGENKTPHIQGYIKFKNARTFKSLKKILPRAHIEKAKGTIKQNYDYCSKEQNFITNIDFRTAQEKIKDRILEKEYNNVQWKPWQQEVINELKNDPDQRKINWIWEEKGNVGKSFLVKYLALKHNVIIGSGKKNDVFNQINTMILEGKTPTIILLDIPRDDIDYLNYGTIEQIKNGCLYSGKYEGGICLFEIPHIYIFANTAPIKEKMSLDRWKIRKI